MLEQPTTSGLRRKRLSPTPWIAAISLLAACSSPPRIVEELIPNHEALLECRPLCSLPWPEESEVEEPAVIGGALYLVEKGEYSREKDASEWRVWRIVLSESQSEPRLVFTCPGYAGFPVRVAERMGVPVVILTYPNMKEGAQGELESLYLRNRGKGEMYGLQIAYPYFAYLESDWFGPLSHISHMNVIVGMWVDRTPRELFARSYVDMENLSMVVSEGDAFAAFSDHQSLRLAYVEPSGRKSVSTLDTGVVRDVRLAFYMNRIIPIYVKNYRQLVIANLLNDRGLSLEVGHLRSFRSQVDEGRLDVLLQGEDNVMLEHRSDRGWTRFKIQGEVPRDNYLLPDAQGALVIGRMKDKRVAVSRLEPKSN